jgi:TolA-binding protein
MATQWGILNPSLSEKTNIQKWLIWAKAHQEMIAVAGITAILLAIVIPYYFHSKMQNEKEADGVLNLGQFYFHSQIDPKNGPFKNGVEKDQQALQTFQRIITDYAGTPSAKIARYYAAKCQYSLGQMTQAYANFDVATQELKGNPLGDEAFLGKMLCLEAQNQMTQAANLANSFLKDHPDSFLIPEIRLNLADIFLKINEKNSSIEQLKLISKTYPDSNWGKEAERRIKGL